MVSWAQWKPLDDKWDMAFIRPHEETFSSRAIIHTDPGNPTRMVIGKHRPSVGELVCVSSWVFGARCGLEVNQVMYGDYNDQGIRLGRPVLAEHPKDISATAQGLLSTSRLEKIGL